jgi:hypothetical protein
MPSGGYNLSAIYIFVSGGHTFFLELNSNCINVCFGIKILKWPASLSAHLYRINYNGSSLPYLCHVYCSFSKKLNLLPVFWQSKIIVNVLGETTELVDIKSCQRGK